jgi:uncharacterized protein
MFRLIYYAILAYLVYSIWRFVRSLKRRTIDARPQPRLSGMMVKDEACDTYIPKEEALREVVDGKEYFFCSQDCRKKFLEARNRS